MQRFYISEKSGSKSFNNDEDYLFTQQLPYRKVFKKGNNEYKVEIIKGGYRESVVVSVYNEGKLISKKDKIWEYSIGYNGPHIMNTDIVWQNIGSNGRSMKLLYINNVGDIVEIIDTTKYCYFERKNNILNVYTFSDKLFESIDLSKYDIPILTPTPSTKFPQQRKRCPCSTKEEGVQCGNMTSPAGNYDTCTKHIGKTPITNA